MIAACVTDDCDGTGCACDCHDGREPWMADDWYDDHDWSQI